MVCLNIGYLEAFLLVHYMSHFNRLIISKFVSALFIEDLLGAQEKATSSIWVIISVFEMGVVVAVLSD